MNFPACGPGRLVVSRMNGTRLMCGYLSNLHLSALLAMSPGLVLAAETRDGLQEKGATVVTSRYVTDPSRLKTRSMRACSVFPLTKRVRAGTSCSMNTLTPLRLRDVCETSRHCCSLRATPPPYRHPLQLCCCGSTGLLQIRPAALLFGQDCTTSVAGEHQPPGY